MSSKNQVEFNILVQTSKAETALKNFSKIVDKTIGKAVNQTVALDKSISRLEKKFVSLGKNSGLRKFNNSINKTEKNLDGLEKKIRSINKLSVSSKSSPKMGGMLSGVFSGSGMLSSLLGGALGGGGAYMAVSLLTSLSAKMGEIIQVGVDFEHKMTKINAILNLSNVEFSELTEVLRDVAKNSSLTADQIGDIGVQLSKAGKNKKEIESMVPIFADLAVALDKSTESVTKFSLSQSNSFGVKGSKDIRLLSDLNTKTLDSFQLEMDQLETASSYMSTISSQAGMKILDQNMIIGSLSQRGIPASKIGTGMRSGLLNMLAPSEKNRKIMDKHGMKVRNDDGSFNMDVLGKISSLSESESKDLFGKTAYAQFRSLGEAYDSPDFAKNRDILNNSAGSTAEKKNKMMQTSKGLQDLKNSAYEDMAIVIGGAFKPILDGWNKMMTAIYNGIGGMDGFWSYIRRAGEVAVSLWSTIFDILGFINEITFLSQAIQLAFAVIGVIMKAVSWSIKTVYEYLYEMYKGSMLEDIFSPLSDAKDWAVGLVDGFTQLLSSDSNLKSFFSNFSQIANLYLGSITEKAKGMWSWIWGDDEDSTSSFLKSEEMINSANKLWGYKSKKEREQEEKDTRKAEEIGQKDGTKMFPPFRKKTKEDVVDTIASVSPLTSSANSMSRSVVVNIHDGLLHVDNQYIGMDADGQLMKDNFEEQMSEVLTKIVSDFELGISQ